MNTTAPTSASPEGLRNELVDYLLASEWTGLCTDNRVESALRQVPRHEFVPSATLEAAYEDDVVITKRATDGRSLSCASTPTVVAMMLVGLQIRPGDNILEIGAGTGYNAALLAHLTGPTGEVTTVDLDPEVTACARVGLARTGYDHVHVVTGDGLLGYPDDGPYDRMIVTAAATDLPLAWWGQLSNGARLVVPLRWRGLTRAIAFTRTNDLMRSDVVKMCGFVPLIGQEGAREAAIDADGHVSLSWDADQSIEPERLRDALQQAPTHVWTGVTVGPEEPFDGVWLRLTATETGTCRINADDTAVQTDLCKPAIPHLSPAIVEESSFAYFTFRRDGDRPAELGAVGHGTDGAELAERLAAQIRAWGENRTTVPTITAYPADTPDRQLVPGTVIDKPNTRLVLTY